jgi:hypothetical protein
MVWQLKNNAQGLESWALLYYEYLFRFLFGNFFTEGERSELQFLVGLGDVK